MLDVAANLIKIADFVKFFYQSASSQLPETEWQGQLSGPS